MAAVYAPYQRELDLDPVLRQEHLLETARRAPRPTDEAILRILYHGALRPLEQLAVLAAAPTGDELRRLTQADVEKVIARALPRTPWQPDASLLRVEHAMRWLESRSVALIWFGDEAYPDRLREQYDPPPAIFVRGEVAAVASTPAVAVVGTRHATRAGKEAAYQTGYDLAAAGYRVVSGLAAGIDSDAHRGTTVADGVGVAVLGSGIDTIWPSSNRELAIDVLEKEGAIVSEYPPGVPPARHRFPARNRIIAALGQVLVVIEAPGSSGALITVGYALQMGKEIWVHEAGLPSSGCRYTVDRGANLFGSVGVLRAALEADGRDAGVRLPTADLPRARGVRDPRLRRFGSSIPSPGLARGRAALALLAHREDR